MDSVNCVDRVNLFTALHDQYKRKNAAYGNSAHRTFEEWGETAYLVRISDKINRINQLMVAPQTDDIGESVLDTIGDCITYILMLIADCNARAYEVNGKTYDSAIEDEFAKTVVENGLPDGREYEVYVICGGATYGAYDGYIIRARGVYPVITLSSLRKTWELSSRGNGYRIAHSLVSYLADCYIDIAKAKGQKGAQEA